MKITVDGKNLFDLDHNQLKEVNDLLKQAFSLSRQKQALTFYPGLAVSFIHKGRKIYGLVKKVNSKSVSVTTDIGVWNCSPGLLTVEEKEKEKV